MSGTRDVDQSTNAASKSIEDVVQRCAAIIRGAARRFSMSEADVDELTQEIRLRLWSYQRRSGANAPMPSTSYVYSTAMSAALDLLRRRRANRSVAHFPLDEAGQDAISDRSISFEELAIVLETALAAIPVTRRPVVRLHLSGYGLEEIARITGNTVNSTRNLLYRGLADLRAALEAAR